MKERRAAGEANGANNHKKNKMMDIFFRALSIYINGIFTLVPLLGQDSGT